MFLDKQPSSLNISEVCRRTLKFPKELRSSSENSRVRRQTFEFLKDLQSFSPNIQVVWRSLKFLNKPRCLRKNWNVLSGSRMFIHPAMTAVEVIPPTLLYPFIAIAYFPQTRVQIWKTPRKFRGPNNSPALPFHRS